MVIAIVTTTLDGKIALSEDDQIVWHSDQDMKLFVEDTKKSGVVIMGSTTYTQIALRGRTLPGRKKIVLTSKPQEYREKYPDAKETEFTSNIPQEILDALKKEGYEDVCVIGGGKIYSQFLDQKCIDEIRITLSPYVFGSDAISFITDIEHKPIKLHLLEVTQLEEDFIRLRYKVIY